MHRDALADLARGKKAANIPNGLSVVGAAAAALGGASIARDLTPLL